MATTYRVSGMTCGGCARSVEMAITAAAPGAKVRVDLSAARVIVDGVADSAVVEKAVTDAGFTYGGVA
ncbi:MAG: heavy-metal-associated domain-containing protein [Alphaproteobacteria bacterium]